MGKIKFFSAVALLLVLLSGFVQTAPVQAAPAHVVPTTAWCGRLSSFTTWYWSKVENKWKPILYVWKGQGRGNPYSVRVYYDNNFVPDADDGIRVGSPQVDNNNGWVGYFLSTRWTWFHRNWDDDWRWKVLACLP